VSEDSRVDDRDVDDWERRQHASHDSKEEKSVLPNGVDYGERPRVHLGIHVEQRSLKVLYFPRCDAEQNSQNTIGSSTGAEDDVTAVVVSIVAAMSKLASTWSVSYHDKADQTQGAEESAIDEFVDNETFGEDANLERVGRSSHDVGRAFFESQADGEEAGSNEVCPQNLKRREGECRVSFLVFEREADQKKDDLGNVGDEQVEKELNANTC